jgi:hypothetical protein
MPGFRARLRSWFTRPKKPSPAPTPEPALRPEPGSGPIAATIGRRINHVAESILENESLTSDLDDSAARELIDWGLSVARQIAQGTAGIENDDQAEQAMLPRLRATQRLMLAVNRWIASQRQGDTAGKDQAFNSILEQASIIYGRPIAALNDDRPASLSGVQSEQAGDPPHMIAHLRHLIERAEANSRQP